MQFILDNIAATFIGTTLLVILLIVNMRTKEVSVDETNFSAMRHQQVSFIHTLQRDISGVYRLETVHADADDRFTFWTRLGSSIDTVRITYQRSHVGERDGMDLYQVLRYEGGSQSSPGTPSGGSPPTLVDWHIVGLNRAGNAPENPGDVRQISVRFEALLPYETGNNYMKHPWQGTFFPVMLETHPL